MTYTWFKNCVFRKLRGGLSGVFYVENSNVYFSNPDGKLDTEFLGNRMLSVDEHLGMMRRNLDQSKYVSRSNIADRGASFLYAVQDSSIIMRGLTLQDNQGREGGTLALRESTLQMRDTYVTDSRAETFGGFLYSSNSWFNMTNSYL